MIKIFTLGEFDIKLNGESLLEKIGSQNRLILLFKYFLTHTGKRVIPSLIVEDLMVDKDLKEPEKVLRTQISRLRKLFNENTFYTIDFQNGYYVFNLKGKCLVDFQEFENKITKGNMLSEENPDEAMEILKEALLLYKGVYLPEVEYAEWIVLTRHKLDRIYLKGLYNYLFILKMKGLYHEIIDICEKSIQIKPYEEFINKYFMEALMEIGQKRYALSHYEYFTSKLYNDLRTVPSLSIKEVYKELQNHEDKLKNMIDLNIIDKELASDRYKNGALICELHYFKFLYNWELRNKGRKQKENIFLGIISLDNIGYTPLTAEDIKQGMNVLMSIVYKHLRKSDVLSKWNDSQLVTLLYNITENDLHLINNRLQKNFEEKIMNKNIILNIKFKPL
ncbi:MAG: BTAD domain-containing putative transcriptional regulator [Tissierellaceae bacterium]|nr:BTAD domain-containing putative transcriptional regulator [Tissierellaceae bacterium]